MKLYFPIFMTSNLACIRIRADDGRRRTTDDDDGRRTTDDDDDDDDDEKMSTNIFKPCHHIDLNTTNPNPILKITIPFTKTPTKPKHFRTYFKNPKFSKIQKKLSFSKVFWLFWCFCKGNCNF